MKNQTSNWNYLADRFCPLSRNKLDRHAIVTTKIVRRTLTPERAMSGALFAGTRCQVWPTAPQPLPCLATTSSAGWQPNQLEPLKLGGGPPSRGWKENPSGKVQSAWPGAAPAAAGALCQSIFSVFSCSGSTYNDDIVRDSRSTFGFSPFCARTLSGIGTLYCGCTLGA